MVTRTKNTKTTQKAGHCYPQQRTDFKISGQALSLVFSCVLYLLAPGPVSTVVVDPIINLRTNFTLKKENATQSFLVPVQIRKCFQSPNLIATLPFSKSGPKTYSCILSVWSALAWTTDAERSGVERRFQTENPPDKAC